jgi:hypothetical protein
MPVVVAAAAATPPEFPGGGGGGGGGGGSSFGITGLAHEKVDSVDPASVTITYVVPTPKANPSIATTPSATQVRVGQPVSDSATLAGGSSPTGTVTFALYANALCSGTPAFTSANRPLSGATASSTSFMTTTAGTFHWVANYSGDANNNPAATSCSGGTVTITAPAQPRPKITAASISAKRHRATFTFKASGASRFQCALVKQPTSKHEKASRPRYAGCRSPKTYKHLKPARYIFYVRATGAGALIGPAVRKSFRLG